MAGFITKAKGKVIAVLTAFCKINCTDCRVFIKIFDAQIQPALLYASEVRGTGRVETVEKMQLFAIKMLLSSSSRTQV